MVGWRRVILFLWAAFLAAGTLVGCNGRAVAVTGSGTITTESRPVEAVSSVTLAWTGELTIHQGEVESLTITADENILPLIGSKNRRGELVLGLDGPWRADAIRPSQPVRYELTVRDLSAINLTGAGDIRLDGLTAAGLSLNLSGSGNMSLANVVANSLTARLIGSGSVKIDGEAGSQDVTLNGSGAYQAAGLRSQEARLSSGGSGQAIVWVTRRLEAAITGSGSIGYYGTPQVSHSIRGTGSVQPLP
jgi:hypothetical protein